MSNEQRRARFEEKAFAQRFLNSVKRVNDGQFGLQPVDCPTKAEFVAKDADGNYLDNSLNFAWWGWNAALDGVVVQLPKKFDRTGDLHFCFDGYETVAAIEAAGVQVSASDQGRVSFMPFKLIELPPSIAGHHARPALEKALECVGVKVKP